VGDTWRDISSDPQGLHERVIARSLELMEERANRKTFALIVRGQSGDFLQLVEHARASGLYVVYTKTSDAKIVVQEVPW